MPGYNVTPVEAVKEGVFCPHCHLILREAIQTTEGGHRLCESCYKEISSNPDRTCHQCGISFGATEEVGALFYPDRAVRQDIVKLLVKCDVGGCPWVAELKHFEEHCLQCQYKRHREKEDAELFPSVVTEVNADHQPLKCTHDPPGPQDKMSRADDERVLKQMEEKLKALENTMQIVIEGAQSNQEKVRSLESTVKQQSDRILQLEKEVRNLQAARPQDALEKHQQSMPTTMGMIFSVLHSEGTFLWPIPDVAQRCKDALDGKVLSLYSPPFYISRSGYKVCLQAFLNGKGPGKDTHISIFLVLMKGENDCILKWPFQREVSFTLVDQSQKCDHIVKTFVPGSKNNQRPHSEMNVPCGCPQFARVSVLKNGKYVKDDIMIIACAVTPVDSNNTHNQQRRALSSKFNPIGTLLNETLETVVPSEYEYFPIGTLPNEVVGNVLSPEYETFHSWFERLLDLTKHGINTLANQALANWLIPEEVHEKATNPLKEPSERARVFYNAIRSKIKLYPEALAKFLSLLKCELAYKDMACNIETEVRNRRGQNFTTSDYSEVDLFSHMNNYMQVPVFPKMLTSLRKPFEYHLYPSGTKNSRPTSTTICQHTRQGCTSLTFSFLLYLQRHICAPIPRYSALMIFNTQSRRCTLTFELTNESSLYLASYFPQYSEVFALGIIIVMLPVFPGLEPSAQLLFFPMPRGFDLTEHV